MSRRLALVTLLVRDYDEALAFFTDALGFELIEDTLLAPGKRWLVVGPPSGAGAALLLARAVGEEQEGAVGRQAGDRVGFFLHTDDFETDHARMISRGVRFLEPARSEAYGVVAVFADLYGNRWDLLQPSR